MAYTIDITVADTETIDMSVEDDAVIDVNIENSTVTTDTRTNISQDGTEVVSNVEDINFSGSHFNVVDDGDKTVTTSLLNDDITVAGNTVSLGGSTTVDYIDLNDTGSSFPIPNSDLANSSITVAGNSVSLGSSTVVDHSDLSNITESDHRTDENIEDLVNSLLVAGDKLSWTYDDAGDTLTIDTTALDEEEVEDAVNSLISDGNAITTTYDDANDTLTVSVDETSISHENISDVSTADHRTDEQIEDLVDSLLEAGDKLSWTYDDAGDILTIDTSALDEEEVEDAVNSLLSGGNAITTTYDDAGDTLTIDVDSNSIDSDELVNDSITVAGNSVSLGGSTTVSAGDLSNINLGTPSAGQLLVYDGTSSEFANAGLTAGNGISKTEDDASLSISLTNDSVEVAGNTVSLGGSTTVDHVDLSNIGSDDHHSRYTDEESQDATNDLLVGGTNITLTYDDSNNDLTIDGTDTRTDISDSGGVVVSDTSDITFTASNDATVSVSDDADGTGTVDISAIDTTYSAGDGLKLSGTTFNIEPVDFAGNGLEDDGSDNLAISSNAVQTDEIDLSISPTWTGNHTFNSQTTVGADIVPDSAGSINIGSDTNYFNDVHASSFKTHSKGFRNTGAKDLVEEIKEGAEGSMDVGRIVTDLAEMVLKQQEKISKLEKRIENE